MGAFAASKLSTVRAAFIGVGNRGRGHLKFFSSIPNTEVVAISDLYEENVTQMRQLVKEAAGENRHTAISEYWGDENKWRVMLEETKPDVVFIATNWKNHAPMAIGAMESGAHAFVEVPLAVTIEDLWKIVDTSETTQKHCMMMENVNYGRDELLFLNMCRKGVLGELLHAEAAYIHELRSQRRTKKKVLGLGEHPITPREEEIYIQHMVWGRWHNT